MAASCTSKSVPQQVMNVAGLGPGFRPTPSVTQDRRVVSAWHDFRRRMYNKSVFKGDDNPIPKFYVNRNAKLKPTQDAEWWGFNLDVKLQQVISSAPASKCTVQQNMSPDQRRVLKELQTRLGDMLIIRDDKVNGFVLLTRQQFLNVRSNELSGNNYTSLDQCVNLAEVRREGKALLEKHKEALGDELVTFIKAGISGDRMSRLNLQGKSHKGIDIDADVPICVRAIVDAVGYPTTPAATAISKTLSPMLSSIKTHVQDTEHAIVIIEDQPLSQDEYLGVYDIKNFYPTSERENCRDAVSEKLTEFNYSPEFNAAIMDLEQWITKNVVFCVPTEPGKDGYMYFRMSGGYGIGLGHSREMTDIEWARREEKMMSERRRLGKKLPTISLRMVDDGFFTFAGTPTELEDYKADLQAMDPSRLLTFEVSRSQVNWLDLTLFKGPRFRSTGVLDMKVYRKPTSKRMQLPRISHHPDSTFKAILTGEAKRILRCTNNKADWLEVMNEYAVELLNRGYSANELLDNFLNANLFSDRSGLLKPRKPPEYNSVLALKLPFTERVRQIGASRLLRQFYEDAMAVPSLNRAFEKTRFVLALQRTPNLRDSLVSK